MNKILCKGGQGKWEDTKFIKSLGEYTHNKIILAVSQVPKQRSQP